MMFLLWMFKVHRLGFKGEVWGVLEPCFHSFYVSKHVLLLIILSGPVSLVLFNPLYSQSFVFTVDLSWRDLIRLMLIAQCSRALNRGVVLTSHRMCYTDVINPALLIMLWLSLNTTLIYLTCTEQQETASAFISI